MPGRRPRPLRRPASPCDFFGPPAKMPAGPAALAALHRSGLIPVTPGYEGDHVVATVPPASWGAQRGRLATTGSQATTQSLADVFEAGIRRHPADWHMLQRVWVEDLRSRRDERAASEGRSGLPLLLRRARRRAVARPRPRRGLLRLGHHVSVLAPADDDAACRRTSSRPAAPSPCPTTARWRELLFGPVSANRVRRWIREGEFDVLHVHEPASPSLACSRAGPRSDRSSATFHMSDRAVPGPVGGLPDPADRAGEGLRTDRRVASTPAPRSSSTSGATPCSSRTASRGEPTRMSSRCRRGRPGEPSLGFLGRIDEQRKGLPVLLGPSRPWSPSTRGAAAGGRPGRRRRHPRDDLRRRRASA